MNLLLIPVYRKIFENDVKRAKKRGKDLSKLRGIVLLLLQQEKLPLKCKDHSRSGNYVAHRECHIEPD